MKAIRGLPELLIELAGHPLADQGGAGLVSVRVQQRLSTPAQCEIVLQSPTGALAEGAPVGASLRVLVAGQDVALFEGEITGVELAYGPAKQREVRLRGYDLLHRLRKRQPARAHVDVKLEDLARELTADLGVTVDAKVPGLLTRYFIQHRQSDLELLIELAEQCGLYLALREQTLHLLTLEGLEQGPDLELGGSLLEATIDVNGDPAARTVSTVGWDPLDVDHHEGRATAPRVGRSARAEAPPSAFGSPGELRFLDEPAADDEHAQAAAQAELDRRAAHEVVLRGVAEGDPRLRPGARVDVRGVARKLAGTYVLASVNHTIDTHRGFLSEISTAPPAPRPRRAATTITLGTVTRVDDPDRAGRIRVTLDAFGGIETDWMHVLSIGAGAHKGLLILPDVGDHVLVLLAHQDPAQGLVLGGLHGAAGWPDDGVEGGAVRRFSLMTPGGHTVRLDDDKRRIEIEHSGGSYIHLSPGEVAVHSKARLVLEAPGQAVVIRGDTIDFERKQ